VTLPIVVLHIVLSSLLLILSVTLPPLAPLMFVAWIPFLRTLKSPNLGFSFLIGAALGLAFFGSYLAWIPLYATRIYIIIIALSALFVGIFGCICAWTHQKISAHHDRASQWLLIFLPPCAWTLTSMLFTLTPLKPHGEQIGLLLVPYFPRMVQAIGLKGLAFSILFLNALLVQTPLLKSRIRLFLWVGLIFIFGWGAFPIQSAGPSESPLNVSIVQHNFPIESQWRTQHQNDIMSFYRDSVTAESKLSDVVIFPQYGLPVDVVRKPSFFKNLSKIENTSILLGTYIPKKAGGALLSGERTNSAVLFTPDGNVHEYQATTPPPFRNIGQVYGIERKTLSVGPLQVGILLCYEDVVPRETVLWVENGAEALIALSNPGHFVGTLLPYYHLLHDQARALESGRFVLRASPNGYSAIIDSSGNITQKTDLNKQGVLRGRVDGRQKKSFFVIVGQHLPGIVSWLFVLIAIAAVAIRGKRN
jgi:apolipoprotein N-acyltransferase